MWRRASLSILVLAVATGCIPQGQRTIPVAPPEQPPAAAKPLAPQPPPPPQAAPPLPERKPETAAGTATPSLDPKQLVGLGFQETKSLLGEPTKTEEKPPAQIWTYNNDDCELDIFFYSDINTREFRALTYEIKDKQASGGSDDRCLAQLMRKT
jgi:hypothetical protein